jgi:hypothetical protein
MNAGLAALCRDAETERAGRGAGMRRVAEPAEDCTLLSGDISNWLEGALLNWRLQYVDAAIVPPHRLGYSLRPLGGS